MFAQSRSKKTKQNQKKKKDSKADIHAGKYFLYQNKYEGV